MEKDVKKSPVTCLLHTTKISLDSCCLFRVFLNQIQQLSFM